jgi:hypothetical protein
MKRLFAVVCAIATLFIIGCAGPTQPQQPAANQAPTATEEESIATVDFESGEAETPTETSEKTEADPYAVAD